MAPHTDCTKSRFAGLISEFSSKRILVIGDLMLDEFIWGKVSRISPEAPVPIVNVSSESYYPGGAANGQRLRVLLEASGVDTALVESGSSVSTILKTGIIARNQQVVRVDRERNSHLTDQQTRRVLNSLDDSIQRCAAVVVADYGKGFLTQELANYICNLTRKHQKTRIHRRRARREAVVNQTGVGWMTALMYAAAAGDENLCQLLLAHGADPEFGDALE